MKIDIDMVIVVLLIRSGERV